MSLSIRARFGRTLQTLTTLDIARNGLFVVTDKPPARGQLVHVNVLLPSGDGPLPLRGMVLHTVTGEDAADRGVPAGMGIQFYGLGQAARERWIGFFEAAREDFLAAGGVAHPPTPAAAPAARSDRGSEDDAEATAEVRQPLLREDADDALDVRKTSPVLGRPPSGSLATTGAVLAPDGAWEELGHFRLCPPDVAATLRFRHDALDSGGVVLVGAGSRAPGSPAVVSVVHPMTSAEFHVPGEVEAGGEDKNSIVIRFLGVTERTKEEFEHFATEGLTPAVRGNLAPGAAPELSIFWSAEEAQWDVVTDPGGTVVVERLLPLEAAINPFARRG